MLSLALVFVLVLVPRVRTVSPNYLVNGDFETGTLKGWDVGGVCNVSDSIIHGMYSAYISNSTPDNWIHQGGDLGADRNYHLQGWVYPLEVGSLGPVAFSYSGVELNYYNRSTMTPKFQVWYWWCWNDLDTNSSAKAIFQLNFNVSSWNFLSIDVTQDAQAYFTGLNFSELLLHDISFANHFSNGSPGAFYLNTLTLTNTNAPDVSSVNIQGTSPYPLVPEPYHPLRTGEPFIVTAKVTDFSGSGIASVEISYQNNVTSMGEWTNTTMVYNATTGLWSTTLTGLPEAAAIRFFFTVWDNAGNQGILLTGWIGRATLIPGDLNGNGVVDLSDLVILATHYGQHYP
jgi:hypothetical protein